VRTAWAPFDLKVRDDASPRDLLGIVTASGRLLSNALAASEPGSLHAAMPIGVTAAVSSKVRLLIGIILLSVFGSAWSHRR
jgi:hypothetical protein